MEKGRLRARSVIVLLSLSLVLGSVGAVTGAGRALAATVPPILSRTSGMVTADALPTAQVNGVVWDQAIVGDTVYAGGQFTSARPAGAAESSSDPKRSNLMAYSLSTGAMTSFAPVVNGPIKVLALSPDKKRLYIGGSFTSVNGKTRNRLAAFDTTTGALISSFAPNVSSNVFSIATSASAVYIGGWFKAVNGVARTNLGAVSPSTGSTLAWAPTADSTPYAMALSTDGSRVIVGGIFAKLNGASAPGIGSLNASSGASLPFAANKTVKNHGDSAGIYSVHISGSLVIATAFWYHGTGNYEGMFTADVATGAIKSMEDCHGDTYDASVFGGAIYTVSHHHYCANIGGFPDTNPRSRWQRTDAVTLSPNGTVQTNGQSGYANFGGQPAAALYNWFPDLTIGSFTGQDQAAWTVESSGKYVVEGGEFLSVNGVAQQGLVRFAVPSVAPNAMGPQIDAAGSAPTATATGPDSVQLSWPSNTDADDQTLTYAVYRSDQASPLTTVTGTSQFWNRPTLGYTDPTVAPDTTYSYTVVASDPSGNSVTSTPVSVTTPAASDTSTERTQAEPASTATTTPTTPPTTTTEPPAAAPAGPTKPAAGTVLAAAGFGTATTKGWPAAKPGGSWTVSRASAFSAAKGLGQTSLSAGGSASAGLRGLSASDQSISVDVKAPAVPTRGALVYTLQSRGSATAGYRLDLRLRSDRTVQLVLAQLKSGKTTTLATSTVKGLSYQAGSTLHLRLRTSSPKSGTGAVLDGRVWSGSSAPSKAQVAKTVSGGPTAGWIAVGAGIDAKSTVKVSGKTVPASLRMTFDNLVVSAL